MNEGLMRMVAFVSSCWNSLFNSRSSEKSNEEEGTRLGETDDHRRLKCQAYKIVSEQLNNGAEVKS